MTDISQAVKRQVAERDEGCCIFCGAPGAPNAHIVSRAHGGLGIVTNIVTACITCHHAMDNSTLRDTYISAAEAYMRRRYPGWRREDQVYDKWRIFDDKAEG